MWLLHGPCTYYVEKAGKTSHVLHINSCAIYVTQTNASRPCQGSRLNSTLKRVPSTSLPPPIRDMDISNKGSGLVS